MKKMECLFKRDFDKTPQVYNEINDGCEWVANGEGVATIKYDGTACAVIDGVLYKRYDRKLTKGAARRKRKDKSFVPTLEDFKAAPDGFIAVNPKPDFVTGHWPGWVPVTSQPNEKYHGEAWSAHDGKLPDGTYELTGPKINGDPYKLKRHVFIRHGEDVIECPRDFDGLGEFLKDFIHEGIVFHHEDGRMVKIRRGDFGHVWPIRSLWTGVL